MAMFTDWIPSVVTELASQISDREQYWSTTVETPLGPIVLVADATTLHILEFAEETRASKEIERHKQRTGAPIVNERNAILDQAERDLSNYFEGISPAFETPLTLWGTDFQKGVWHALQTIPPGTTWSYKALAAAVNNPPGVRAVAQANGANQLGIIVPCHRVIQADGKLGGYGGGLWRKRWLLDHEQKHFAENSGRLL